MLLIAVRGSFDIGAFDNYEIVIGLSDSNRWLYLGLPPHIQLSVTLLKLVTFLNLITPLVQGQSHNNL